MKVNILGTEYLIVKDKGEDEELYEKKTCAGFCDFYSKEIHFLDLHNEKDWDAETEKTKDIAIKETIRHEVIHAFLAESGLKNNANRCDFSWARNEEMVDWIAVQFPKILKVFEELDVL